MASAFGMVLVRLFRQFCVRGCRVEGIGLRVFEVLGFLASQFELQILET